MKIEVSETEIELLMKALIEAEASWRVESLKSPIRHFKKNFERQADEAHALLFKLETYEVE